MLKLVSSVPVLLFLLVMMLRGLSAPPSREQSARANDVSPSAAPAAVPTSQAVSSPYLEFALTSFDVGVRGAANARAVQLFHRAQQEQNAIAWMDAYCRKVAGDIAFLRQNFGAVTGEADQNAQLLNRSNELAAAALALHWLLSGDLDAGKAAVNLQPILDQYQEVFSGQQ